MKSETANSPRRVATACSYVPTEIILASGASPFRLLPQEHPAEADAYIHPNTCGYLKSMLACGLRSGLGGAVGIVLANCCDGMRKLHDLWQRYVPQPPVLLLEVPKKKGPDSVAFFASELKRFAAKLTTEPGGTAIADEEVNAAIRTCNIVRRKMSEVFSLLGALQPRVRCSQVFRLCLAGSQRDAGNFTEEIDRFLSTVEEAQVSHEKRIVLSGSVLARPDLILLIEGAGGHVCAVETCVGQRHYEGLVEENAADPMEALARRSLLKPPCARMEGIEERIDYLIRLVEDTQADGVVYCPVKYCDPFLYDVPLLQQRLAQNRIPLLVIEQEYGLQDLGQVRTRLEAFLEMSW